MQPAGCTPQKRHVSRVGQVSRVGRRSGRFSICPIYLTYLAPVG